MLKLKIPEHLKHITKLFHVKDYFKVYKSLGGNLKKPEYARLYRRIIYKIVDEMLKGEHVYLNELGRIRIIGKNPPFFINGEATRKIDWHSTSKLWKEKPEEKEKKTFLYYDNAHTDGAYYKVIFSKRDIRIPNFDFYKFRTSRGVQVKMAAFIKKFGGSNFPIFKKALKRR